MDPFTEIIGQFCVKLNQKEEDLDETDVIVPEEKEFETEHRARM